MKEIIQAVPFKMIADVIYIVTVLFAGYQHTSFMCAPAFFALSVCDICVAYTYLIKCWHVYVQMNWLLIKKEYIIVFVYIFSTVTNHTIGVATPKRVTRQQSVTWSVVSKPRPESIIVKFIYSNHV